jgi:hypothetical protein
MEDRYQVHARDLARRPTTELVAERKEQIALEQAALQADRKLRLAQQRSTDLSPSARIALWESLHGLALPRDPNHPLIAVIAEGTQLDVAEVLAEHERRAADRTEK